jgi:hypothetical protein
MPDLFLAAYNVDRQFSRRRVRQISGWDGVRYKGHERGLRIVGLFEHLYFVQSTKDVPSQAIQEVFS